MTATFLTSAVAGLLQQVAAGPAPDPSATAQRAALDGAMAAWGWPATGEGSSTVSLPSGAAGYVFRPGGGAAATLPLTIYLHGGSFVAGGLVAHRGLAQALSDRSGSAVALVDYRLAPEHPLPTALDDALAATDLLIERAAELGLDIRRLVIAGDSAGGWLAAALALRLVERGGSPAMKLVLVNPMITPHPRRTGSRDEFASGYFAGTADFDLGWAMAGPWAAGPIHPDQQTALLGQLPPTVIVTNEADPVRDEGEAFAEALSAAGVPVLNLRARGVIHASWLFPAVLPEATLLLDIVAGAVRTPS